MRFMGMSLGQGGMMHQNNRTKEPGQELSRLVMKELPPGEQPYEKCMLYGAESLSDAELLAVVIRTGSRGERAVELAGRVIHSLSGHHLGGLFETSLEQLREIRGIGRVKAIQLLCLAELTRRMAQTGTMPQTLSCQEPDKVAAYYMPRMRFLETEQVRLLILDGKNALTREMILSHGSFNASFAAPREVYYYALKHKAVSIILLHNHPSGDPTPSREDIVLTKRLTDVGNMIGIRLLDHIVIGSGRYISFQESGFL
jgi:DNA repair protein RadC